MFQVLVVICIYTIWAFLDYVNLYLIYDKYLTINRRKKKKVIYLWFILMIIIGVSYGLINSDIIHSGFLIFAVFIPYYFKILPVLWTIFPRRYKDVPIVFCINYWLQRFHKEFMFFSTINMNILYTKGLFMIYVN